MCDAALSNILSCKDLVVARASSRLQRPCTLRSKRMQDLPAAQVCLDVYEHAPHSGAPQVEAKKAFMDIEGCARQPADGVKSIKVKVRVRCLPNYSPDPQSSPVQFDLSPVASTSRGVVVKGCW